MTTRTVERSDEWEAVPFAGGFGGLHELAADEFSGKVIAGPTRLFMTRGKVVGVLGGSIDDFEGADGTAREAPHPALPLLAVMQERSDEVRAKYYSEDTPLSEVNQTLEDGNFTGYVELSENVLSGDYYQVYHQGRSMSVAWVGASERLITDDEAFEQADDEVGIFAVRPVDIDIVDVPEPDDGGSAGGADAPSGSTAAASTADASEGSPSGSEGAASSTATEPSDAAEQGGDAASSGGTTAAGSTGAAASAGESEEPADADTTATAEETGATETGADAGAETGAAQSAPDRESGTSGDPPGSGGAGAGQERSDAPTEDRGGQSGAPSEAAQPGDGHSADVSGSQGERTQRKAGQADTTSRDTGRQPSSDPPAEPSRETPDSNRGRDTGRQPGQSDAPREVRGDQNAGGTDLAASDLETRSLPSLDPDRTASASKQARQRGGSRDARREGDQTGSGPGGADHAGRGQADPSGQPGTGAGGDAGQGSPSGADSGTHDSDHADTGEPQSAATASDRERSPEGGSGPAPGDQSADATPEPTDPAETTDSPATDEANGAGDNPDQGDEPARSEEATGPTAAGEDGGGEDASRTDTAAAVEEQVEEIDELQSDLNNLEGERDDLAEERDRLETELEDARSELERLRGELNEAVGDARDATRQLSPREAIEETNLFVRYDSKGDATLETAHAGEADRADVEANLRLEYHTAFDADDAAVDGQPFDDFLRETIQYRFASWLVGDLLYEIRDTGHESEMADLYDAIPRIDRIELNGLVSVSYTKNGEEHRTQEGFDVVARDRMGDALIVANINDSRDPATDAMMTDLVTTGERVGESEASLAGAFLVTRSYFEPESLETAAEATSGGLLSRDKRKSFVNLSRKGGYHLCLVEARNREFHLTVPEL